MELITNEQMAQVDTLATQEAADPNEALFDLMVNAGRAVAQHVMRKYPRQRNVLVLCGPGNNGGDGYIAARILDNNGYQVRVVSIVDRARGSLPQRARQYWGKPVETTPDIQSCDWLKHVALVIDAMFGAGITRALEGEAQAWAAVLAEHSARIISIDVPSGLNADTGSAAGACVRATSTITFFRLKPGHVLYPGRAICGDTELADIGIDSSILNSISVDCYLNRPLQWRYLLQSVASQHKYHRGHTLVFSGPVHATGAARLSARAALRAGAGLVTLATPTEAVPVVASQLTAVMIAPLSSNADAIQLIADPRINSVVIGPGFGVGEPLRELCLQLLRYQPDGTRAMPDLVFDADALTVFADHQQELFEAIRSYSADVVLTPHDGEFRRLFDCEGSRLDRARHAAARSGATVVLKGPDTVVATPDGRASINDNAPPTLATAGAGDVLAGFIAGLLARQTNSDTSLKPDARRYTRVFDAASAGVWLHGECARQFGPGLIAEDLPEQLPRVLAEDRLGLGG